jgi:hypothetical protein
MTADLPPGGSVIVNVSFSFFVRVRGTLVHTATATLAPGDTDPNPANNSATDTTVIGTRLIRDPADVLLAVGSGAGVPGHVKVYDGTGQLRLSFLPFAGFLGGVRVATARITDDLVDDIVVGAGPGAPGGHVKVFDGATGAELQSFFAFPGFVGGVFVAAGDVHPDGLADIIVGAGPGAPGGHVKVLSGRTGATLQSFLAFPGFTGGVTVAAPAVISQPSFSSQFFGGIVSPVILVGAGAGAPGGHVKAFDGATGVERRSFFAFPGFDGGVSVAARGSDLVVGTASQASHVKVFDGITGNEAKSFFAFPGFGGGVSLDALDRDNDGLTDIVAGAGPGAPGGHVKVFDGQSLALLDSFFAFDPSFGGGVFVG